MRTRVIGSCAAIVMATSALQAQRTVDSAGIHIAQYATVPRSADVVLASPELTVRESACELNRVGAMILQRSGQVVIANRGNYELCIFDARGQLVRKVGRRGAGPSEFQAMQWIASLRGDSILVVDPFQKRMQVFGPDGGLGRQLPVQSPAPELGSLTSTATLSDGTLLLGFSEFKMGAPRPEAVMFYQTLFTVGPSGTVIERLGSFPNNEHFIQAVSPQMGGTAYYDLAFGRSFSLAPFGDGFVGGDGTDATVREYSAMGKLKAIHRLGVERRPITDADIASFRDADLKTVRDADRPRVEHMLAEMPYPKSFPAYQQILTDDAGRIWVAVLPEGSDSERRWLRVDPSRMKAEAVRFPARFRLMAVRGGRACGVGRDDVDLETVYCFKTPK
jgi:hypothetical protein